ncbi:MAG: GNAT family N-acetyltransferase [Actinomycetota bacterium]|nr:GNAT family N-acetyltransferase [Actinomycetota bacterium]
MTPLVRGDAEDLLALLVANRAFLEPFEPIRPASEFTLAGQRAAIEELVAAHAAGAAYSFCIRAGGELIGRLTLSQVFRKAFRNCHLGYWVGEEHNGRGYATAAVRAAVRLAFDDLGLHRVQANVMTRNRRSARVLEKAGFRKEGLALRYLAIAGRWEDHDMYAITVEDVAAPGEPAAAAR